MAVALGGRIAEELIFGEDDITTGASGDFQQVTRIARLMVTQLGLSKRLGQVAWSSNGGAQFLGAQAAQPADFSQATADEIDNEVGCPLSTALLEEPNNSNCLSALAFLHWLLAWSRLHWLFAWSRLERQRL